ncbi:hypothetical protein Tfu_1532 [Thermobifida fusca YX]|jgi:uncharacterized membrane protein YgcG|uniref:Uncharacterized protein n=1 Tax=Thermobifida fusca (strain YX) TaxID=269800 RepID=Q47PQ1_THEFY|nr:hypothetical protein [Thermobifida fusca]AAZ55568.1 hypothetical protein Tfu_1532 [Thermobifida fusca YX]QOS58132.1 hypothetical protein IM867_12045 [Thermobifida fusca]
MAPKKRKKARARRPAASRTHATPPLKVSRTPLRVDEPPRWPMLVWSLLVVVWVLGSLTALMGVMASVTVLLDDVTDQARRQGAWALVWLLGCGLGVPLVGTVWAALLRRRVAAALFGCAFVGSAVLLGLLASPGEIWAALRTGLAL